MLYRGRTVLALLLATAVVACGATAGALQLTGRLFGSGEEAGLPEDSASGGGDPAPDGFSAAELEKLNKALALIDSRSLYTASRDELVDGAIAGMVGALNDPYSAYYSKEEAQRLGETDDGAFSGIGADLIIADGALVVNRVLQGTPAERAGLQAGDKLLSVNGQSLEGVSIADAAALIRGPKGTKAKLKVQRANVSQPIELELVRDRIAAETVAGELGEDGIGTLRIAQFAFDTPELVKRQLETLEKGGMKALVLDLRDNPGGVVSSAEAVAELFVPRGRTIDIDEDAEGRRQPKLSQGDPDGTRTYPVVVLVNFASASAAEIVAGALQQSAGAILVGSTTYGKGTVQISFEDELGDGSLMKLTVTKWLLPDGTSVQGRGIAPDVSVGQPAGASVQAGQDPQWQAAHDKALSLASGG